MTQVVAVLLVLGCALGGCGRAQSLDDAGRVAFRELQNLPEPKPLPRRPSIPELPPMGLPAPVETGIDYMRDLWNGEPNAQAIAKAACALVNQGIATTDEAQDIEDGIYDQIPEEFRPDGPFNSSVSSYVTQARSALVLAQNNGGAFRYYVEYCIRARTP